MNRLITILAFLTILASCGTEEQQCHNTPVSFRLINFSQDEADTVLIRQIGRASGRQIGDSLLLLSAQYAQNNPSIGYDSLYIP